MELVGSECFFNSKGLDSLEMKNGSPGNPAKTYISCLLLADPSARISDLQEGNAPTWLQCSFHETPPPAFFPITRLDPQNCTEDLMHCQALSAQPQQSVKIPKLHPKPPIYDFLQWTLLRQKLVASEGNERGDQPAICRKVVGGL